MKMPQGPHIKLPLLSERTDCKRLQESMSSSVGFNYSLSGTGEGPWRSFWYAGVVPHRSATFLGDALHRSHEQIA